MLRILIILAAFAALPAQAQRTDLIGSTFGLEGWNQRTASDPVSRVRVPGRATVRDPGVEFPQVSRLFDTPEGRRLIREGIIGRFVNTWIDIGPNWIEIDFQRAGNGRFADARLNTYVFVFDNASPVELSRARIDPRTTLRITPARLSTQGNRLLLNVQGLYYDRTSFVRIVFDVAPALGGGERESPAVGGGERPAQAAPPPAAPEDAPIPQSPPGISTISGG